MAVEAIWVDLCEALLSTCAEGACRAIILRVSRAVEPAEAMQRERCGVGAGGGKLEPESLR